VHLSRVRCLTSAPTRPRRPGTSARIDERTSVQAGLCLKSDAGTLTGPAARSSGLRQRGTARPVGAAPLVSVGGGASYWRPQGARRPATHSLRGRAPAGLVTSTTRMRFHPGGDRAQRRAAANGRGLWPSGNLPIPDAAVAPHQLRRRSGSHSAATPAPPRQGAGRRARHLTVALFPKVPQQPARYRSDGDAHPHEARPEHGARSSCASERLVDGRRSRAAVVTAGEEEQDGYSLRAGWSPDTSSACSIASAWCPAAGTARSPVKGRFAARSRARPPRPGPMLRVRPPTRQAPPGTGTNAGRLSGLERLNFFAPLARRPAVLRAKRPSSAGSLPCSDPSIRRIGRGAARNASGTALPPPFGPASRSSTRCLVRLADLRSAPESAVRTAQPDAPGVPGRSTERVRRGGETAVAVVQGKCRSMSRPTHRGDRHCASCADLRQWTRRFPRSRTNQLAKRWERPRRGARAAPSRRAESTADKHRAARGRRDRACGARASPPRPDLPELRAQHDGGGGEGLPRDERPVRETKSRAGGTLRALAPPLPSRSAPLAFVESVRGSGRSRAPVVPLRPHCLTPPRSSSARKRRAPLSPPPADRSPARARR